MGKNTDKLYVTHSEWQSDFGGAKVKKSTGKYKKLPFSSCCLTLQPVVHPVCTQEGHLFELERIVSWLEQHKSLNPITGEKLEVSDLIKVNFYKNNHGEYHCPVTFRVFNDHVHIVMVKTTGNIYAYDAIETLNIKPKYWKDLITDEPFKRSDIITLQDPERPELRDMSEFYYVKNEIQPTEASDSGVYKKINIPRNTMAGRILNQFETVKEGLGARDDVKYQQVEAEQSTKNAPNAAHFSKGKVAASFTSTFISPTTVNEPALIDEDEFMFKHIKKKGYVQIKTNLGDIGVELFCDVTPRTCFNFISLAKNGYYNGVLFHRNIPGFMIQGGDPTGTGSGGQSIWGKAFSDEFRTQYSHSERGILSMANKGKNTNGSQFFFTYGACKHLDYKHTIFGKIVGGTNVLDMMETVPTNSSDRPVKDLKISEILILVDPFEDYKQRKEKRKYEKVEEVEKDEDKDEELPIETHVGKYLGNSNSKPLQPSANVNYSKKKKFFSVYSYAFLELKPSKITNYFVKNMIRRFLSSQSSSTTHFGFKQIPKADKERLVGNVFDKVADRYDLMNDFMSAGVHRCWKDQFIKTLSPTSSVNHLDVAGGTGDIAFRVIDSARRYTGSSDDYKAHVTVFDINQNMLNVGESRARKLGYSSEEISWKCGNAEQLPFENETFDSYTIAFGIRNCTNIDNVVSEAHRVLKPGGRFLCLEFGKVENSLVQPFYDVYSFQIIPLLGQLVANDRGSYQYLVESIRKFPPQPIFAKIIKEAGFQDVEWENLTFGVASIHSGWKPLLSQ